MPVEVGEAEETGGYAKALSEDIYQRQRDLLTPVVAASDVVIATAAVPGRPAPMLIMADMMARMARGAVIVDVAADRGGNCELTRPNEVILHHGVTVLGQTNLPSTVPMHASQMYGRNLANVLLYLCKDGFLRVDVADEITRETLVTRGGAVVHPRIGALLSATHHDVAEERNA